MQISNINHPEANNFPVKPNKFALFFGFLKSGVLFVFLLAVIAASFFVSFKLGSRILFPAQKDLPQKIEVAMPETPPSIANLQKAVAEIPQPVVAAKTVAAKPESVKPLAQIATKPATQPVAGKNIKNGYYKVIVGKFSSKNKSMNLVDNLNQSGFATYLRKVGNQWWVQTGAFIYENQALSLKKNLANKGFSASLVFEQK